MTLKHRPGRNDLNPADYVSLQPQDIPKRENAAEAYVSYVFKNAVPKSMTLKEVRKETQKNSTMRKLARQASVRKISLTTSDSKMNSLYPLV